jgi:hypothetical protein
MLHPHCGGFVKESVENVCKMPLSSTILTTTHTRAGYIIVLQMECVRVWCVIVSVSRTALSFSSMQFDAKAAIDEIHPA